MSRRIEIVLPDNPNLGLSLFNIYYYTNKLNVQVGDSVVFWLKKHFCHIIDFQQIQKKHIGEATVSTDKIINFLISLKSSNV